jgi:hypothetical protein
VPSWSHGPASHRDCSSSGARAWMASFSRLTRRPLSRTKSQISSGDRDRRAAWRARLRPLEHGQLVERARCLTGGLGPQGNAWHCWPRLVIEPARKSPADLRHASSPQRRRPRPADHRQHQNRVRGRGTGPLIPGGRTSDPDGQARAHDCVLGPAYGGRRALRSRASDLEYCSKRAAVMLPGTHVANAASLKLTELADSWRMS